MITGSSLAQDAEAEGLVPMNPLHTGRRRTRARGGLTSFPLARLFGPQGLWLFITLTLNFKGHDDGKPSEPPAPDGRYKVGVGGQEGGKAGE